MLLEITKIQTRLEIKNEVDSDASRLYLYGTIRQASWWDDEESVISAKQVRKHLETIKGKNLNVHINSGGGDVFESIAIGNLLKNHEGKVNIYIDGLAGSGASVIAMAGENIYMPKNTTMMIHNAWTVAMGNAEELRKVANDLDKINEAVLASYMDKFVGTEEELKNLLKDESFLTAKECFDLGLCTEILEDKKEESKPEASIKQTLLAKYQKSAVLNDIEKPKAPLFSTFKKQEANQ